MISGYNAEPYAVKNLMHIVSKELRVSGFIVGSLYHKVRRVPLRIHVLADHALSQFPTIYPYLVLHCAALVSLQYREGLYKEFPAAIASGTLKYSEDRTLGLEGVGEAIVAVQKGTNKGKKVIVVAEE